LKVGYRIIEGEKTIIKAWVHGVQLEAEAEQQLKNAASLPFIHKWVAAMPDCHWGMGATVGSVIPTIGAIVPAAVGVDIGCGMIAARLNIRAEQLPDTLAGVRAYIEGNVPHGRTDNGGTNDKGSWRSHPTTVVAASWQNELMSGWDAIVVKHSKLGKHLGNGREYDQLGTLGTGNHFIEVCLDENNDVWVMLHSGSRGVGNRIGRYFIERAKQHMERWKIELPDADLAYLPEHEQDFRDYVEAVGWAQRFAYINRQLMLYATIEALRNAMALPIKVIDKAVNCHHNYVEREHHYGANVWVTRKGAVRARQGDLGIIPGSMGARSYIVRGKGNKESFESCSHGAGRAMSRGDAKRRFTVEDHIKATEGVECRKDAGVIDETPGAYKAIDDVMAAQSELVDVVHTLKAVVCVKG
jgi:tRNA-splicing ligase RtcB